MFFTPDERKRMLEVRLEEVGLGTFTALADKLGTDKTYVSKLVNGAAPLSRDMCEKMAIALRMWPRAVRVLFE